MTLAGLKLSLCPKSPPIPLNKALFEGAGISSGVQKHSGHYRVHLFTSTMHPNNKWTTVAQWLEDTHHAL